MEARISALTHMCKLIKVPKFTLMTSVAYETFVSVLAFFAFNMAKLVTWDVVTAKSQKALNFLAMIVKMVVLANVTSTIVPQAACLGVRGKIFTWKKERNLPKKKIEKSNIKQQMDLFQYFRDSIWIYFFWGPFLVHYVYQPKNQLFTQFHIIYYQKKYLQIFTMYEFGK